MCISNDGPEVFSSYASRKSRSEIAVWMPWPLNYDLRGGAKWPSNHFRLYTARCICTEAQEMRAPCTFDWQLGYTDILLPLWNAKSQIRSLVCTLRNSNIAITSLVCTLHNSNITITSLVCTLHNSNDNSNYALCSRVKTVLVKTCHENAPTDLFITRSCQLISQFCLIDADYSWNCLLLCAVQLYIIRCIRLDMLSSLGPFTLAKTKIQKTWLFCCTVYTARKTHNIRGFWHEKRMREKPESHTCVLVSGAHATLYLWPYTCSAHYVAGRGRVIPLKVTYHVTKNPNNTGEIGASVYIGKKPVKFRRSFKKSRCGGGFFDSFFFSV